MKGKRTPRIVAAAALVVFIVLGCLACASAPEPTQAEVEASRSPLKQGEQVIGTIEAEFRSSWNYANPRGRINVNNLAYDTLLIEARKQFQGNIDVRDIVCVVVRNRGDYYYFTTSANVVSLDGVNRGTGVEGALERAAEDVAENFNARSRIAIVYITAQDRSTTEYITGELEHILQRQGFVIIDRAELDRIRAEQQFGASLEVDDYSAARIGHIAGASIVITGRVDGEGSLRRLRLRALDTTSAQVIGTASERL